MLCLRDDTYPNLTGHHVRFGSKADMCSAKGHVRFTPNSDCKSGHLLPGSCLLYPHSGHVQRNTSCLLGNSRHCGRQSHQNLQR
jgi:hypothetical protein